MAKDLTGLNSLRQALTPYEDVKFELNLNRHPKAHKNKSIVYAKNMKLSKDGAVLENEESIVKNELITETLNNHYTDGYSIVHIIPCNTELVLFIKSNNSENTFNIWRYREKTNKYSEKLARFYNKGIEYHNGKFSSTFTYTSNNSLIIAFCEYDSTDTSIMNPMMTINLGTFTEGRRLPGTNKAPDWISTIGEFNDRNLESYKLPICPEVSLPQITNVNNIKGNSYIGTYYVYIRYKINKYDYTQWFNIGSPIINEFKQNVTLHEKITKNEENSPDGIITIDEKNTLKGAYKTNRVCKLETYINQDKDLINSCIDLKITHNNLLYSHCQIGFICIAKTYTKYYVTSDIKLNKSIEVSTNIDNLTEEIFNTNIYENYYNVKNIINKNNKLYISNYQTTNNSNINVNNVTLSLQKLQIIKNENTKTNKIIIGGIEYKEEDVLKTYPDAITKYINDNYDSETISLKLISLPYFLKINNLEHWIKSKYASFGSYVANSKYKLEDIFIGVVQTTISGEVNNTGTNSNEVLIKIATKKDIEDNFKNGFSYNYEFQIGAAASGDKATFITKDLSLVFMDENSNEIENSAISLHNNRYNFIQTNNIYIEDYLTNKNYYFNNLGNKINNNIITGLCQGEVYDFYIHFIDKYGYITDGYKLKNKDTYYKAIFSNPYSGNDVTDEVCFVKVGTNIYLIPRTLKLCFYYNNIAWTINLEKWAVKKLTGVFGIQYNSNRIITNIDSNGVSQDEVENIKNSLINITYLPESYLNTLTFGDICDYQPDNYTETNQYKFIPYYNSQDELFFKVPKLYSNTGDIQLGLKVEIGDINNYGDYVSYFISHKKLEKTYTLNGFGTKNQINNIILNSKFESGNIIKLYDIKNKTNWDLDIHDVCTLQENIITNNGFTCYTNLLNKLGYANDGQLNRIDRQTTLYLSDSIKEFNGYPEDNENTTRNVDGVKYLEVLNLDKNKYINNKKLYRLGNIEYTNCIIDKGLNGKYDKHLAIKYGNNINGVNNLLSNTGIGTYGDVFLYEIFGFFDFNDLGLYLSEKAKFHDIYKKKTNNFGKEYDSKIGTDIFYEVITTLNLFNYKINNIYDTWINFYNVFDENNDFLKEFNRTIYRSAVISDEGRTNNWRWFENDAYKNIEENKGNITNLVAIGNYLYVHTEHSLFAFSEDNTLSMNNQNLQVATPDIFNTEYKEVFITKLGYGGLQDKDAWIAGQFGYIWFDSDSKKIFKVYGNSMDIISNDIQEWLENAHINKIKFANDIKNNRILICFNILDSDEDNVNVIISYNILSKSFISFHDFSWDNSYNTKNNLYYLYYDTITEYKEDDYGMKLNYKKQCSVSFIINSYYKDIKYLESIIFKLRQRPIRNIDNSYDVITDYTQFPVEYSLLPFQPKSIHVYNDLVDTGIIRCDSIDEDTGMPKNNIENYKTPYWNLGNWNFNFLRDMQKYPEGVYEDYEARLFGNYFIITFDFESPNTLIEFENLDVQLTEDKEL